MAAPSRFLLLACVAAAARGVDDGGLRLALDPLPKRYGLEVDGQRRSSGWADGVTVRIDWTPPQSRRSWTIAIGVGGEERRDRGLRERAADVGFDIRRPLLSGARGEVALLGRYGVGGAIVDDDSTRAWGAVTGGTVGLEGSLPIGGAGGIGAVLGYEARWVRDVVGVASLAGIIHGPVAALSFAYRW